MPCFSFILMKVTLQFTAVLVPLYWPDYLLACSYCITWTCSPWALTIQWQLNWTGVKQTLEHTVYLGAYRLQPMEGSDFMVSDRSFCSHVHYLLNTWSPDAVKHISILEYPKQFVVSCNLVKVCSLFICKEQVRFPNGVQHRGVQVQRVVWILLISQSRVIPLLSQKYIEPVVL